MSKVRAWLGVVVVVGMLVTGCGDEQSSNAQDVLADAPRGDGGAADAHRADGAVDLANTQWTDIGLGVAYREAIDASGDDVLIVYGGYTAQLSWVQSWSNALYSARLRHLGARHIYAVQGPKDVDYAGLEIGNSKLAAHLVAYAAGVNRIYVTAHSSGAFVAHELLRQLTVGGLDRTGVTRNKIAYYNLDGGGGGFGAAQAAHLAALTFVYARDGATSSANAATMKDLASTHAARSVEIDASSSGCQVGAVWCLHDAVITDRPHDPTHYDLERDYQRFDDRNVVVSYF